MMPTSLALAASFTDAEMQQGDLLKLHVCTTDDNLSQSKARLSSFTLHKEANLNPALTDTSS